MEWMQHTCRQAAELMSLQRDEPLGFWRGLGLKLHLRMCGDCREVEKQIDLVGDLSAKLWGGAPGTDDDDQPAQR
jgi:hypothetical protein